MKESRSSEKHSGGLAGRPLARRRERGIEGPPAKRHSPNSSRRATGRRTEKQRIGRAAENIAASFLRDKGLEILERNYLCRLGELDIVARDRDVLVIAEIRTRATNRYGGSAASVDLRKQQRLIRAASQLLQQRRDLAHLRVRFDVVAVSEIDRERPRVDWIQHAFST
jgi:putative endonuclease